MHTVEYSWYKAAKLMCVYIYLAFLIADLLYEQELQGSNFLEEILMFACFRRLQLFDPDELRSHSSRFCIQSGWPTFGCVCYSSFWFSNKASNSSTVTHTGPRWPEGNGLFLQGKSTHERSSSASRAKGANRAEKPEPKQTKGSC